VLAIAVLLATTTTLAPAGGLTLHPDAPPSVTVAPAAPVAPIGDPGPPPPLRLASLAASVVALAQWTRRKTDYYRAAPTTAPEHIRIVFVPGHGSPATGTFDQLMERLEVRNDGDLDVTEVDLRDVEPWESHRQAAQKATSAEMADGLASILRTMSRVPGGPIYLVGHSKGAAAIAALLARWDGHPALAVDEVYGAALLDPPISGGWHGRLQSLGRGPAAWLPNDGGYTPRHCDLGLVGCGDSRAHLGEAAGVEVVVFRNPEAAVANFDDDPAGLRVYEVRDPDAAAGSIVDRISAAHGFPLQSVAVAACIADEMRAPGSCSWPIRRWLAGEW
jgi:hypothetical protein